MPSVFWVIEIRAHQWLWFPQGALTVINAEHGNSLQQSYLPMSRYVKLEPSPRLELLHVETD